MNYLTIKMRVNGMKWNRIIALLLCAVVVLSVLASCGVVPPVGPGPETQPTETPGTGFPKTEKWVAFEIPFESKKTFVGQKQDEYRILV